MMNTVQFMNKGDRDKLIRLRILLDIRLRRLIV